MAHGIIDGERWRRERIAALQAALAGELEPAHREAVEAELAEVQAWTGPGRGGWRRWLVWGARRPGM